jgi:hypothetical protein
MVLSLVTAALLNSAAGQVFTTDQLPNLFVSACFDGSVRMSGGDATPITFGDLPDGLRSRLGSPSASKVWRIRGGNPSYLYLLDYSGTANPKICGVASENLALRSATAVVETRLYGRPASAGTSKSTEWLKLDQGYKALATRAGGYTILQVNWLAPKLAEAPRTQ